MDYEALIQLVKEHEEVYNTKSSKYRDIALRIAAWEEISDALQKPVEDCKDQWNKLRNCYNNAMKRREKKPGTNGKKFAPWRFEEQMAFLKQYKTRHTNDETNEIIPSSPEALASPEHVTYMPSPQNRSMSPSSNLSYHIKETPNRLYIPDVMEERSSPKEKKRNSQELDEIDHFFLSMSKTVKNLPKIDQIRVKMEIHRAVNEAELRQHETELRQHEAELRQHETEQDAKKFKFS